MSQTALRLIVHRIGPAALFAIVAVGLTALIVPGCWERGVLTRSFIAGAIGWVLAVGIRRSV